MKVVHLVPKFLPSIGGVENFVYELVKMQRKEINAEIITSDLENFYDMKRFIIINDFPYVKRFRAYNLIPFLPRGLGIFSPYMLKEVLNRKDIDIIHSHSLGYFTTYIGSLCKSLKGTKHIIQTHSDPGRPSFSRKLLNIIAKEFYNFDKIIAISEAERNYLQNIGIAKEKIVKIPIGLNLENFKIKTNKIDFEYILFVGRFDIEHKGIDILLLAFKKISEKYKDINLVLVGSDSRENRILNLIGRLALKNRVFIKSNIPKEELIRYYQHCKFLVLPSRFEPFGMVILEAFACGKPVIATKVGGIKDIVNIENGILVNPENVDELALAMEKLLNINDNDYELMSSKAIETAKKYDIKRINEQIIKLYYRVLESE